MSDSPITHRSFTSYIDRTRQFYAAQGYEKPYRWAHHTTVPFTRLAKPLAESRVAIVTTASPFAEAEVRDDVSRAAKQVWSGDTQVTPDRLHTGDLAWDRDCTHMNDVESFVPLGALRSMVDEGRVLSLTKRLHGVPTDYSQRRTIEQDAPEIVSRCLEDGADVALLVPI